MQEYAYCTYTCSDDYVDGVIALLNSIRDTNTIHDVIVMVTCDVSENNKIIIKSLNGIIVEVPYIYYNGDNKHSIKDRYNETSWKMFTKLNLWNLTDYKKLLYIDADAVVLQNIDHIFKVDINDGIAAVVDGSKMLNYTGIEAGVMLLSPNNHVYNNLLESLNSDKYDLKMTDQSFLNDYFKEKIVSLDPKWNTRQKKHKSYKGSFIYHWNGKKPWKHNSITNFELFKYYFLL